jgi:chromosome segregation ATPase
MTDDMKSELHALKSEVHKSMGELRKGMDELRVELRHGLGDSRRDMDEIRSMFRRTMIHVAQMTGDLSEMTREIATKADISKVTGSIAGLSGKVDDMHWDWATNHDRLNAHEKRLDRLDPRRA